MYRISRRALVPISLAFALTALGAMMWVGTHHPATSDVRTVTLGGVPQAIALDATIRHAIVLDNGCGMGLPSGVSVIDMRTHAVLRTTRLGGCPWAVAVDTRGHRAFIGDPGLNAAGHVVDVIDTRSGALLQRINVGVAPTAIAVDGRTARVFVALSSANSVVVLDGRTGTVLHRVHASTPRTLAIDERTACVYVMTAHGVTTLDGGSGSVLHSFVTGAARVYDPVIDAGTGTVLVTTQPVDRRGVPMGVATVHVLAARSGRTLRALSIPLDTMPIATDARAGRLVALTTQHPTPSAMYSAPDSIGVFDLRSGRVVHMTLPSPDANVFAAAADGTRGRVVVTGRRILTIIDARNGGTLRTLRTDSNNETVTIDPATGTAYVSGVRPPPTTVYDSRWFQWVPWRPAYHDVPPTGVVTIIDTGSLR